MPRFTRKTNFLGAITDADISEVSKKVYLDRWKILLQTFDTDVYTILTHPKKYIAWIKSTYENSSTQKSYLSAILAVYRHNQGLKDQQKKCYAAWYSAFDAVHSDIEAKYRKNGPSSKQMEGYVPYEEIVKKRDELESGSDSKLLLSMYTYIPPLRCDFNEVRIYDGVSHTPENEKGNRICYHHGEATMHLTEFKTSKKMDPYKKVLPEPLTKELAASLHKHPRSYLFEDKHGKPYMAPSYTKWANRTFHRLFDKNLTVSLIRHSYINSLDFNKLTVEEKEQIAKDMAHTVGTQDRYRLIFDRT